MPFQPAPSIAGLQLRGVVDSQLTINDLYFFSSGAITPLSLQTLVDGVQDWFATVLTPLLSDDWSSTGVHGVDLGSATGAAADASAINPGGVSGEANPNNVAMVVSFRTAQRGRSGHGRNFVPGIPGSAVTLNTLDPAFISDVLAAYAQLIGAGTFVTGWQWVVLSRQTEGELRANGVGIPITSVRSVTQNVKSMRSREVGHGA